MADKGIKRTARALKKSPKERKADKRKKLENKQT